MWSKNRCSCIVPNDDQGLRILTKIVTAKSNVVIKPICLTDKSSASSDDHRHSAYCYLKSCHLCSKPLPLDKEVYMYRGDLGFCSVSVERGKFIWMRLRKWRFPHREYCV